MKKSLTVIALLIVTGGLGWYLSQHQRDPRSEASAAVSIRLKWLHQAQFAGFYAADKKGFYREEGLSVDLKPGGVEFPSVIAVVNGSELFGVAAADQIILERSEGAPIVCVAVIYRTTPMVLFSLADKNIKTAKDLVGKKVGVKLGGNEELTYRAIARAAGIDTKTLTEIPVKYDMTPLFEGLVDVWPGYLINEVLVAKERKYDVNIIDPKDYGILLYADALFTTETMTHQKPEVVKKVVRATLRGWQYAYDHPEDAAHLTLEYNPKGDYTHELAMMSASLRLLKPDAKGIGSFDSVVCEQMKRLLTEQHFLRKPVKITEAFDSQFVDAYYAGK
jgi:NitT/TauT family transport system substrate-binding protein